MKSLDSHHPTGYEPRHGQENSQQNNNRLRSDCTPSTHGLYPSINSTGLTIKKLDSEGFTYSCCYAFVGTVSAENLFL